MSDSSAISIVLPAKPIYASKTRLADALSVYERGALCLILLDGVLQALSEVTTPHKTIVYGGDPYIRYLCRKHSVTWRRDPGTELNSTLEIAAMEQYSAGAKAVMLLPTDLGTIDRKGVECIFTLSHNLDSIILVGSENDGGTNAILCPKGLFLHPLFGDNSFTNHLNLAYFNKMPVKIPPVSSLSFDVDTPADLEKYFLNKPSGLKSLEILAYNLSNHPTARPGG